MQVELLNDQGQAASKYDAPETVFGREYNEDLVHQIVVAYQANAYGPRSCWYDLFAFVAWRWSDFPEHA